MFRFNLLGLFSPDRGGRHRDESALRSAQDFERPIQAPQPDLIIIGRGAVKVTASGRVVGVDDTRERYESALRSRVRALSAFMGCQRSRRRNSRLRGAATSSGCLIVLNRRETTYLRRRARNEVQAIVEVDPPRHLANRGELFGEGSLFAKVLKSTVTAEQSARHEKLSREAALHQHRASLQWVLGTWEQMLGLDADQRRRLECS